jgi:hypothetical protein
MKSAKCMQCIYFDLTEGVAICKKRVFKKQRFFPLKPSAKDCKKREIGKEFK